VCAVVVVVVVAGVSVRQVRKRMEGAEQHKRQTPTLTAPKPKTQSEPSALLT